MHWNTHSTKAHCIRFINCCLAAPFPVPASARHHDWALAPGLACWGMQLRRVSFKRLAVVNDDQWPAHQLHQPEPAFEGLGVQVVAMMMSSNWNVKDVTTKY
jgi:hypothetical protein